MPDTTQYSTESADTVISVLYDMTSRHMISSLVQPSTESADTVSTLGYEVSTGHMLPSRTQPSTDSADTVGTLGYEVSTGHMLTSRTHPRQSRTGRPTSVWGHRRSDATQSNPAQRRPRPPAPCTMSTEQI